MRRSDRELNAFTEWLKEQDERKLAYEMNVTRQTMHNWMTARNVPSFRHIPELIKRSNGYLTLEMILAPVVKK